MKIGIITNLYPPYERGGAEQIACRTVRELHRRGHEVFVVSSRPFSGLSSLSPQITENHVERVYRAFPVNIYHVLNDHKYPLPVRLLWHMIDTFSPHAAYVTRMILEREQPDVVITHNLKGWGLPAAKAVQRFGAVHIHTLHDVQLSIPSGLMMYGKEHSLLNRSYCRKAYERAVKWFMGKPNVVISPSQFLANFYQDRGFFSKSRWEHLPNPAPSIDVSPRLSRHEGPLRLLFAGQLEPHKGILFLLKTLSALEVPFELHIAGDGSLSDEVVKWAEKDKRITYHGFVSLGHLTKLFGICDAVVVPSLCYENSPTIIYEAFEAGIPVVAADIGGVGELVQNGKNGYLFTPGDARDLRTKLKSLWEKVDWFPQQSGSIRASVRPHRIEAYIVKLEELIQEQLTKRNK